MYLLCHRRGSLDQRTLSEVLGPRSQFGCVISLANHTRSVTWIRVWKSPGQVFALTKHRLNIIISILYSELLVVVSYAHERALVPLSRQRHPAAYGRLQHRSSAFPGVCPSKIGVCSRTFPKHRHSRSRSRRCVASGHRRFLNGTC